MMAKAEPLSGSELDEKLTTLEELLDHKDIVPLPWSRSLDDVGSAHDECLLVCQTSFPDEAHGDLIVEAVNSLPSLIATLRALKG